MKDNKKIYMLPTYPCTEDLWTYLASVSRPIVVYGMGNGADKLTVRLSSIGISVSDYFASDDFVRGQAFHGKTVLSFDEIKAKYSDFIILVSFGTRIASVMGRIEKLSKEYELYIPDMPVYGDEYFDCEFYNANYVNICKAMNLLKDKRSISVFCDCIRYKLTGNPEYLISSYDAKDSYLSFVDPSRYINTVDAGAYNGDTISELSAVAVNLKSTVAIEPDLKNYTRLLKNTQNADIIVLPYNGCAWCEDGERIFSASGNRNSSLVSASYESKQNKVRAYKIDTLVGDRYIDYIKYDVEGVEKEALEGSVDTVLRCLPDILVSVYHKSEDIFSLILQINKISDKYAFSLRRTPCFPAWELNLYAYVPANNRPLRNMVAEDLSALQRKLVSESALCLNRLSEKAPKIAKHRKGEPEDYGFNVKVLADIYSDGTMRREELDFNVDSHFRCTFTAKHLAGHIYIEKQDGVPMLAIASTRHRSWMYDKRSYTLCDQATYERFFCISEDEDQDAFVEKTPDRYIYESICFKVILEKRGNDG